MGAASPRRRSRPPSREPTLLKLRWHAEPESFLERDLTPVDHLMLAVERARLADLSIPRGGRLKPLEYTGNVFSALVNLLSAGPADDEATHEHVLPLGGSEPYACQGDDPGVLCDLWNMPGRPKACGALGPHATSCSTRHW